MTDEHTHCTSLIPGYRIGPEIYESQHSITYRGIREQDGLPVVIKVLKCDYPPPGELARYHREYEISALLKDKPGIIKVLELTRCESKLALITEDFGALSLKHLLEQRTFGPEEALFIGSQVASSLHEIHSARIIHKDLNPANILYNPTTREVKLIDFGISSSVPREEPGFAGPALLEGTLAYISPEQTGRSKYAVDFRTDFYSLGATLYHLLTGALPFDSDDSKQLIFQQIFKDPMAPHLRRPEIPRVVSDIVMKLMAKAPDQRYQTALGIAADLEHCLEQSRRTGNVVPFELGHLDMSTQLLVPQKLYGREEEVRVLLESLDRLNQGSSEVVLVSGYSGIGKTSLVRQIFPPLTEHQGHFISGKFDQLQRGRPYSAFLDAFSQLARQLMTESDKQLAEWRCQLMEALGTNGRILTDLIPELTYIIGPQPEVSELSPTERQNRFNLVFQQFLSVFCKPEHPLVLFIDDLQWADLNSLKLLELCLSSVDTHCLLLLGAYRDNEVPPGHPLLATLEELRRSSCRITRMSLSPLKLEHVTELLADTLLSNPEETQPLAELLHARTDGNPFFLHELLHSLYSDGQLTADVKRRRWRFDLARIRQRGVSENVVELMVRKIGRLSKGAQEALKQIACLGVQSELSDYCLAFEGTKEVGQRDLEESVGAGLLLPLEGHGQEQPSLAYRFVHDRVQQAAYSLLETEEKERNHFRIGTRLKQAYPPEQDDRRIFEIANHLNQARARLPGQGEKDDLARLNLMAGRKAKTSSAYEAALGYFTVGRALMQDCGGWEREREVILALTEETAEAALLVTNFPLMWELTTEVLVHTQAPLDKQKAYQVRIAGYIAQNNPREATREGLSYLRDLGVSLPENPGKLRTFAALIRLKLALSRQNLSRLSELPLMTDPYALAVMRILLGLSSCLFQSNPYLLVISTQLRMSSILKYGNSIWSGSTFSGCVILFSGVLGDVDKAYRIGELALQVTEKYQAWAQKCRINLFYHTFAAHCRDAVQETLRPLLDNYQTGLESGDFEFAAFSLHVFCQHGYLVGLELEQFDKDLSLHTEAMQRIRQTKLVTYNQFYRQAVLNLLGHAQDPCVLIGDIFDEHKGVTKLEEIGDGSGLHGVFFLKLHLCCMFQRWQEATVQSDKARQWLAAVSGNFMFTRFFLYDSIAWLKFTERASALAKRRIRKRVRANQRILKKRAMHAPKNHEHAFMLVEAERQRVFGTAERAERCYQRAIALARENDYPNDEGLANELAAQFYLSTGQEDHARTHFLNAHFAYARWGAVAKVNDLEARYPEIFEQTGD